MGYIFFYLRLPVSCLIASVVDFSGAKAALYLLVKFTDLR